MDKGCGESGVADILGFCGYFDYRIKVGATKNNACIRICRMQCQIYFITSVETHAGSTYDIF
jgi:hypothetical protein